jgi:hypothetical protein
MCTAGDAKHMHVQWKVSPSRMTTSEAGSNVYSF